MLSSVIIHVEQKIKMSHARVRQSAQGYRESAIVIPAQDLSCSISKSGCFGCAQNSFLCSITTAGGVRGAYMSIVGIRLQDRALTGGCGVNPVDVQIQLLGRSVARFYRI